MRANRPGTRDPNDACGGPARGGLGGYRLNWRKAPGRPDIAYPGRQVAIFVHGCYWHHCPRCYPNLPKSNPEFWARKFELNQERDARKRRNLEAAAGWSSRPGSATSATDLEVVLAMISRAISATPVQSPPPADA